MKKYLPNTIGTVLFIQLFALQFLFTGCALFKGIDEGADPIVVHAERTTGYALDVLDAFVKFEYDNRQQLAGVSSEIKKYADFIRQNGRDWLVSARNLTKAYKANRTEENKFALSTALAVLQTAMSESQRYTAMGTIQP